MRPMTKLLFFLNVLLLSINCSFAQHAGTERGHIQGAITTSDGKPAAYISVKITGSKWGTISNEKGEFVIKHITPGNWKIKISAVGMVSQEKEITIVANETLQADFVLTANASQLQEVIVSSGSRNKENRIVAKMPLNNLENPQVYSTVSSEILKQQAITTYDDALRNVPGITRTWESTGRGTDGAAYFALRGFDAQPILYNGLPGITSGNLDPSNVEAIEVIKGPSGTLFGGSFYSYGGMINTITKKPYFDFGGEVAYNFGSFGLNRITADINTPLSKQEKIALRINTAYHAEGSFQDAGFKKSFFIAPSLTYIVNDRLSFQMIAEILEEERAVPPVFFHSDRANTLPFKTIKELNLNRNLSFTSNDITIKNPRYNLQAQLLYKLSDQWTSQTVFSRGTVKSDGYYTYIWDDSSGNNYFNQVFHKEQQTIHTIDIQQNFNGDFKIGNLRNRLLVGLDYFNRSIIDNGYGWERGRSVTPQGDIRFVEGTDFEPLQVNLTKGAIENLLAGASVNNSNASNSAYSAYISNVLNITPRLMAMASVRVDHFDNKGEKSTADDDFDQTAVSPKFGLVYQPVLDKVSLFANYMNGFFNVAPRSTAFGVKSFKAEHANQLEYGVKANIMSGKLFATVSVYDIRVSNRVVPVAGTVIDYTQGGEVESKGMELDITASPFTGLHLMAGYSYNATKIISGNKTDFYGEPGRMIGGQGPQNLANFWATYKFTSGKLQNFGMGIGGNYGSEYRVIDNSATGRFNLPAYTILNASIFYHSEKIRVACNVNNLNDEVYYIGYWSVNPQRPRNFVASIAYKF
jgi:iron complex outermembrane receptor protein